MKYIMLLAGTFAVPSFAFGADLAANDYVGVSFWLVTAALLAATVFFFAERDNVSSKWKTSLTVSGLVTGIAFWHYMYMRGVWVDTGTSPTVYRYIDWLLTVPLLIVEFYLILRAVTDVATSLFYKLFVGSIIMLSLMGLAIASKAGMPWYVVMLVAPAVGFLCGLFNGIGITLLKMPHPFIMTLGTLYIFRGVGNLISGGVPITGFADEIRVIGNGKIKLEAILGEGSREYIPTSLILMIWDMGN